MNRNASLADMKDTVNKDRLNVTVDSNVEIVEDKTYLTTIVICATVFTTITLVSILTFVHFYKRSKKPTPIITIIQQQPTQLDEEMPKPPKPQQVDKQIECDLVYEQV
jgi:hypothetical protein